MVGWNACVFMLVRPRARARVPTLTRAERGTDDEVSTKDKVCGALKYTTLFIVFFAVLIGLGILLRHGQFDSNGKPDQEWISKLRGNFDAGDAILSFCIGVLASLGLFGWLWYTSYGLSHMPVSLMRSTYVSVEPDSSVKGLDRDEVQRKLQRLQTELDFIGKRYDGQARAWSDADRKRKQQLDVEKRALEAQLRKLQRKQEGRGSVKSRCITCWRATAPLRITVGLAMLALSGLVLASLAISTIDKAMHSDCKAKCGYTLDKPRVTNPIDWALNQLSPYFPIDFALYAGVTFFIFLCTISALVDRGVGLLCWKLYEVKKERTEPHGLILGTWLITFTVLLLNMQLLTLAPQYTTFGRQFYIEIDAATNATRHVACEVSRTALNSNVTAGDAAHCAMTQVATFINSLQLAMPFFGAIFYFVNYAFLGLALLAVAYVFLRKPVSTAGYQEIEEVDDF
jgi:LMBR1 domain-containing protein 1